MLVSTVGEMSSIVEKYPVSSALCFATPTPRENATGDNHDTSIGGDHITEMISEARHGIADARRVRMATESKHTQDIVSKIVITLALIGAINWGLIGFFNFNLVDAIFGGGAREQTSGLSRVIYALVGIAGVIGALMLPRLHPTEGFRHHRFTERPSM